MLNSQSFNSFMNTSGEDFSYEAISLDEIIRTVEILEEVDEEVYDLDYITEEEYAQKLHRTAKESLESVL